MRWLTDILLRIANTTRRKPPAPGYRRPGCDRPGFERPGCEPAGREPLPLEPGAPGSRPEPALPAGPVLPPAEPAFIERWASLTLREREIVRFVLAHSQAGYLSADELARSLGIATATLRCHLHRVYTKLGVHSRRELVELQDLIDGRRRGPYSSG